MDNFTEKKDSVFIIAELSANHNGSLDTAIKTIRAAKQSGANGIKLQTYTADTLTVKSDKEDFRIKGTLWAGKTLYDLYQEAYTPWKWHEELFRIANEEGLLCFSSPFDKTAVDFLESLNNPIYKIASFEITDIPLIKHVASTGKPIIISTGIATEEDIKLALDTCRSVGNNDITLLKCTSSYPAPISDANLIMIPAMKEQFNVRVGLSDHTIGSDVAIASVALGAQVIEKHFIFDRKVGGPDAAFSMEPDEFEFMVNSIRNVEQAIGEIKYPEKKEDIKGRQFARSLYVVENIEAGSIITEKNVRSIRPGFGLHPKYYEEIIGKKIRISKEMGERLRLEDIVW